MSLANRVLLIEATLLALARNVGQLQNVCGELEAYREAYPPESEREPGPSPPALDELRADLHAVRNELAALRATSAELAASTSTAAAATSTEPTSESSPEP